MGEGVGEALNTADSRECSLGLKLIDLMTSVSNGSDQIN